MKIFQRCYDWTIRWAQHPKATYLLGTMSVAESVIFPVPVDVMLAPMALAKPSNAWRYALIASIGSVLGGILGYLLGLFAFESLIQPIVIDMGYQAKLDEAIHWFKDYGVWVVFLAGFSPIPYKVFTISAGFLQLAIIPFIIASLVGRSLRFYLVAGLMRWGGQPMQDKLRQHVEIVGWATVVLAVLAYFYWSY
ncbi:YqaA family protein [Neptunicella marina]|uniref:DedA family protein n=1 Tax=Neptunicella marina TaxID=2125989 RepID=A0A8J6IVE9_9ALTE|nr:YqaA family protein [Neptunicella marina]MBC3766316.1 DedA family protein [Neptunicella marina]